MATGTPDGGVAIVRLSGPRAREIGAAIAGELSGPRRLVRRSLRLGGGARESALVVLMPGPESLTGEDVVELQVHAGALNVRAVVERVLALGAAAAGPGAFTRRAFELGRIDLTQAEGVAALIGAQTEAGLAQARRLAGGELGGEAEALRARVFALRGELEAHLDFPEDDLPAASVQRWQAALAEIEAALHVWQESFEAGRRARERARIVLAGPPNAGKSALLNALVGRERVIVSAEPGTTRDYVEVPWRVGGREVVLVDTAGQREGGDPVEAAGVKRALAQVADADVVVWVEGSDQPAVAGSPPPGAMQVEAKRDLGATRARWLGVSAQTGSGLPQFEAELVRRLGASAEGWIGLARHRDRAQEAAAALADARELLARGEAPELAAFQLAVADDRLGAIGGRMRTGPVGEEILAAIFERFCIGK